MRTFGEILKAQRQKLGLTQKQVADNIGMSDAYICSLESDKKSPPPYYTVSAIADVLKLDPEQLWKVAMKYREKQALEKARRREMVRRRISATEESYNLFQEEDTTLSVSDSQVDSFFARPEVRMSAIGLFQRYPEDMTIEEKRVIYQAISKAQEFLDRARPLSTE